MAKTLSRKRHCKIIKKSLSKWWGLAVYEKKELVKFYYWQKWLGGLPVSGNSSVFIKENLTHRPTVRKKKVNVPEMD